MKFYFIITVWSTHNYLHLMEEKYDRSEEKRQKFTWRQISLPMMRFKCLFILRITEEQKLIKIKSTYFTALRWTMEIKNCRLHTDGDGESREGFWRGGDSWGWRAKGKVFELFPLYIIKLKIFIIFFYLLLPYL